MTDEEREAFKEKIRSIQFAKKMGNPRPKEYRRDDGVRVKETIDDAGNMTRLHNTGDTERQDVEIRPAAIVQRMTE